MHEFPLLYGFSRTTCACDLCKDKCRHLSGLVTPADLERWRQEARAAYGIQGERWMEATLAASPGALVMREGEVRRIPTIVPRRLEDGRCRFLTLDERCAIHHTAPYGCSHFDCQQSREEGDARVYPALVAIMEDWATDGPYSQLWLKLAREGRIVDAPEVARSRLLP